MWDCSFLQKAVTRPLRPGEVEGPEIVTLAEAEFRAFSAHGAIVATYSKYDTLYGLFAHSGRQHVGYNKGQQTILGLEELQSHNCLTVGDAYESPRATRACYGNTVVILLHASMTTVIRRIWRKRLSHEEQSIRLAAVSQEFKEGFPDMVVDCDYRISTEGTLPEVSGRVVEVVLRETRNGKEVVRQ